jgi:hypothetical protein
MITQLAHINFFFAVFLCLFFAGAFAQQKTMNIWPGKIPDAIDNPSYKIDTIYIEGNRLRLTKVTNPTMDMYPATGDDECKTAIIICPGGGYGRLAIDHEGTAVAQWLNGLGITAFVLKYRLPSNEIMRNKSIGPLQDGQEAIRIVRRHAKALWDSPPAGTLQQRSRRISAIPCTSQWIQQAHALISPSLFTRLFLWILSYRMAERDIICLVNILHKRWYSDFPTNCRLHRRHLPHFLSMHRMTLLFRRRTASGICWLSKRIMSRANYMSMKRADMDSVWGQRKERNHSGRKHVNAGSMHEDCCDE